MLEYCHMKQKIEKIHLAKEFRKKPTDSEKIFWEQVKAKKFLGLKFRRQSVILGFIVDFYCPQLKLIIEIDGAVHLSQKDYDDGRERELKKVGYRIIRFKAADVEKNVSLVLQKLKKELQL